MVMEEGKSGYEKVHCISLLLSSVFAILTFFNSHVSWILIAGLAYFILFFWLVRILKFITPDDVRFLYTLNHPWLQRLLTLWLGKI